MFSLHSEITLAASYASNSMSLSPECHFLKNTEITLPKMFTRKLNAQDGFQVKYRTQTAASFWTALRSGYAVR